MEKGIFRNMKKKNKNLRYIYIYIVGKSNSNKEIEKKHHKSFFAHKKKTNERNMRNLYIQKKT